MVAELVGAGLRVERVPRRVVGAADVAPPEEARVPAGEGPRRRARAHVAPHGVPVADVLEVGVRHEHAAHAVASDLGDDQAGRDGRVAVAVAVAEARRVAAEEVRRVVHVFVRERRRHEVRVLPVLLRAEEPAVHEEAALVDEHAERRREEHAREVARHGLRALGHRRVLRQRRLEGGLHARVEVEVRGAPQEREQQQHLHDDQARAATTIMWGATLVQHSERFGARSSNRPKPTRSSTVLTASLAGDKVLNSQSGGGCRAAPGP